jgi:hypothetical protein
MLPFVTILVALVFFLLWRWGVLDDLRGRAQGQGGARWKVEKPRPKAARTASRKTDDRLEVFQKFIEKLPDDDDQDPKPE